MLADDFVFLEGPRWRDGEPWVGHVGPHGAPDLGRRRVSDVVHVPARPSGLGFLPDGTPLVVPMANRVVRRLEAGRLVVHADVSGTMNVDLNDLVVDSHDRAQLENCGYDLFAGADPKRQS